MRAEAVSPAPSTPAPRRAAGPIAWETSEPAARDRARRARLPLLVWLEATWAAPALEMERKTWTDPRVQDAARPFVALRLDLSAAEGDAERYAERYKVDGVPSTILFDAQGRRVATLYGYQDPETIVAALARAAGE
jgi:thiol:disulfide interchange protein DsbD